MARIVFVVFQGELKKLFQCLSFLFFLLTHTYNCHQLNFFLLNAPCSNGNLVGLNSWCRASSFFFTTQSWLGSFKISCSFIETWSIGLLSNTEEIVMLMYGKVEIFAFVLPLISHPVGDLHSVTFKRQRLYTPQLHWLLLNYCESGYVHYCKVSKLLQYSGPSFGIKLIIGDEIVH